MIRVDAPSDITHSPSMTTSAMRGFKKATSLSVSSTDHRINYEVAGAGQGEQCVGD